MKIILKKKFPSASLEYEVGEASMINSKLRRFKNIFSVPDTPLTFVPKPAISQHWEMCLCACLPLFVK